MDNWALLNGICLRCEILEILSCVPVSPLSFNFVKRIDVVDDVLPDLSDWHIVMDWHIIFHSFKGVYSADRNVHAGALLEGYELV